MIAELNLARAAGLSEAWGDAILSYPTDPLTSTRTPPDAGAAVSDDLRAVIELADAVTRNRTDAPEARDHLRRCYGEAGLIELVYAMNGAALLPGLKRGLGYATTCDLGVIRKARQT